MRQRVMACVVGAALLASAALQALSSKQTDEGDREDLQQREALRLAHEPGANGWMAVRSAGADGSLAGPEYRSGAFPPGDPGADVVWIDGYFARWPQDSRETPSPVDSVGFLPIDSIAACELAERLAQQRPCVDAKLCGSYRNWQRLFGAPKLELLEPEYAGVRMAVLQNPSRLRWPGSSPPEARSFICPAR